MKLFNRKKENNYIEPEQFYFDDIYKIQILAEEFSKINNVTIKGIYYNGKDISLDNVYIRKCYRTSIHIITESEPHNICIDINVDKDFNENTSFAKCIEYMQNEYDKQINERKKYIQSIEDWKNGK